MRVSSFYTNFKASLNHFSLCSMSVGGSRAQIKAKLVCLPLEGLDVILGMDWMTTNGVLNDCGKQKVDFLEKEKIQTFSSREVL